jgi:hypothetical protein
MPYLLLPLNPSRANRLPVIVPPPGNPRPARPRQRHVPAAAAEVLALGAGKLRAVLENAALRELLGLVLCGRCTRGGTSHIREGREGPGTPFLAGEVRGFENRGKGREAEYAEYALAM